MHIENEAAMRRLADDLAAILQPGDLICLSGDLGAGKSTLVRAVLRALADDEALEVPSPTFTLVQSYDLPRLQVSHLDLYRLEDPEEVEELGLTELLETGAAFVEWPEKGEGSLPEQAIWIRIEGGEDDHRNVSLHSELPGFEERFERSTAIRNFLQSAGWGDAKRRHLTGDASARSYEKVHLNGKTRVLMNSPALYTDEKLGAELSYSQIVHLAKDIRPFVAVGQALKDQGFGSPEIYAADLTDGLILLEDLGPEGVLRKDGTPDPERYHVATELLAALHNVDLPEIITLDPESGDRYELPVFSDEAFLAEASLFLDWYVPEMTGKPASQELRAEFETLWRVALGKIANTQKTWVLRDYHSPNLIWQASQKGLDRIRLIDFQDALIGPTAYDVASLLFDARVDVPETLERDLYQTYVKARAQQDRGFDEMAFQTAYAVMAAQRITKILGIFVRLARRDHKPAYLKHLPRMNAYLDRALAHPVMTDLKQWFERNRP
ncbi:MAG: tRNA (adenosine(37)-N6)-threonylcarbamoyltransferase complex ATPase subunit type 1 TsaE [Rhodobacteraceae bacterium]|nr:tRNA (adenosine(37)-N6)-threonylcarbamoyltransferase complex ATPase subunit type 1 TsaE [Paracoccaceae bacterium]